jgi:predicted N-formylglutamate amidohydrolase
MSASNQKETTSDDLFQPRLINSDGRAPVLLICEHATNYIPDEFNALGLTEEAAISHAAWDPGALDVACQMARKLDAPLISASVSRLLYDCNRPPEAHDSIPAKSEKYEIPGNKELSDVEREERVRQIYCPFANFIDDFLNRSPKIAAIITVHSFTPVYNGAVRAVDIGLLHDEDTALSEAVLAAVSARCGMQIRMNEPYSSSDGVTHTLHEHGTKRGLLSAMIEIKNNLITNADEVENISSQLSDWTVNALQALDVRVTRGV